MLRYDGEQDRFKPVQRQYVQRSSTGIRHGDSTTVAAETSRGNAISGVTVSEVEQDKPAVVFHGEDAAGVPIEITAMGVDGSVRSLKLSRGRQSAPYTLTMPDPAHRSKTVLLKSVLY